MPAVRLHMIGCLMSDYGLLCVRLDVTHMIASCVLRMTININHAVRVCCLLFIRITDYERIISFGSTIAGITVVNMTDWGFVLCGCL